MNGTSIVRAHRLLELDRSWRLCPKPSIAKKSFNFTKKREELKWQTTKKRIKGSSKMSTARCRAGQSTSNRKRPGAIRTAANRPAASKAATKTNKRSRTNKADTALERRATEKKRDVKVGAVHTRAHFDDPKGLSS